MLDKATEYVQKGLGYFLIAIMRKSMRIHNSENFNIY